LRPLPGETILLESDNQNLVLTSHRVRCSMQTMGLAKVTSIMLEELSACEITTTSSPWLFVLALLVFLIGLFANTPSQDSSSTIGGALIALAIVLTYFGTRQRVISLRAAGGAIIVPTKGMDAEVALEFIDTLEAAKNDRFLAARRASAGST